MFDPDTNTGLLFEKLRYKKRKKGSKEVVSLVDLFDGDDLAAEEFKTKVIEIADAFKDILLPRDKDVLMNKLKETSTIRKQFLCTDGKVLFESLFPLYVVDISLVKLFEFQ